MTFDTLRENNFAICLAKSSIKNQNEPDKTGLLGINQVGTKNTTDTAKTPFSGSLGVIPEVGLEPTPCRQDGILNPARLPIPPLRLKNKQGKKNTSSCQAKSLESAIIQILNKPKLLEHFNLLCSHIHMI